MFFFCAPDLVHATPDCRWDRTWRRAGWPGSNPRRRTNCMLR